MVATADVEAPRRHAQSFATVAIGCFVYAVIAVCLMHVLRPDYVPAKSMISAYGVGPYGWIMTTAFLAAGAGCLMLVLGLARTGPRSNTARFAMFLIAIASIGLVVSAEFPMDVTGPATRTGDIHDISFLVNIVSLFLAALFLAAAFGTDARWRRYQRGAVVLAALLIVGFVLQFLTLRIRGLPYGFANRLFAGLVITWLLTNAVWLRRVARR